MTVHNKLLNKVPNGLVTSFIKFLFLERFLFQFFNVKLHYLLYLLYLLLVVHSKCIVYILHVISLCPV